MKKKPLVIFREECTKYFDRFPNSIMNVVESQLEEGIKEYAPVIAGMLYVERVSSTNIVIAPNAGTRKRIAELEFGNIHKKPQKNFRRLQQNIYGIISKR